MLTVLALVAAIFSGTYIWIAAGPSLTTLSAIAFGLAFFALQWNKTRELLIPAAIMAAILSLVAPLRPERRASETSHARLNLIVTVFTRVCMPWPIVNSPSLCREARAPAVQPELRRSPIPISLHRLGRGGDDLEG